MTSPKQKWNYILRKTSTLPFCNYTAAIKRAQFADPQINLHFKRGNMIRDENGDVTTQNNQQRIRIKLNSQSRMYHLSCKNYTICFDAIVCRVEYFNGNGGHGTNGSIPPCCFTLPEHATCDSATALSFLWSCGGVVSKIYRTTDSQVNALFASSRWI